MALLSPAAVAVHDDSDVAGEARKIERLEEVGFLSGDGSEGFGRDRMVTRRRHCEFRVNPLYGAKLTQGW